MYYTKDDIELLAETSGTSPREVRQYLRGLRLPSAVVRDIQSAIQDMSEYFSFLGVDTADRSAEVEDV